jgi:molybdopterin adenylyltransferase
MTLTAAFRAAVVTVSDSVSAGARQDVSGPALAASLRVFGAVLLPLRAVPDEAIAIAALLRELAPQCDLIVTTGGTGLAPRDVTPEATAQVCSRLASGLAEHLRQATAGLEPRAWLSRGIAGVVGPLFPVPAPHAAHHCLIINFPGSPRAVNQYWQALEPLLPHALSIVSGDSQHH